MARIKDQLVEDFSSVQFSRSVMSDSLQPHESQHARPPCPSPTSGVYSNSCPSSRWCHPGISSSVVPFFLLPPIPPSIRVFSNESTLWMRWPKTWEKAIRVRMEDIKPCSLKKSFTTFTKHEYVRIIIIIIISPIICKFVM